MNVFEFILNNGILFFQKKTPKRSHKIFEFNAIIINIINESYTRNKEKYENWNKIDYHQQIDE